MLGDRQDFTGCRGGRGFRAGHVGAVSDNGDRIITRLNGNRKKIRFAISSFNDVPLEPDYFDCAFLIAAIHHSVTPLREGVHSVLAILEIARHAVPIRFDRTLTEVLRVLKPNGSLLVIEATFSVVGIRKARDSKHQLTIESGGTRIHAWRAGV